MGFETEVRSHLPALYRRALRLTHDRDRADDLLQDTLERGYRKRALFQPGTDLRAWLFAVMRSVWINGRRRRANEPDMISLDALDEVDLHRRIGDQMTGLSQVEASVVEQAGETTILSAIAALPPRYRDVVLLADVDGTPYKTIAETLQIPVGSVCSRLSRARERVRSALREQADDLQYLARAG